MVAPGLQPLSSPSPAGPHADRTLVLHHGELRESEPHEDLVAMDGLYARLSRLQHPESAVARDGRAA